MFDGKYSDESNETFAKEFESNRIRSIKRAEDANPILSKRFINNSDLKPEIPRRILEILSFSGTVRVKLLNLRTKAREKCFELHLNFSYFSNVLPSPFKKDPPYFLISSIQISLTLHFFLKDIAQKSLWTFLFSKETLS